MQPEQLQRLMRLARKTKSPLILTDPEGNAPMVLMGVDQYESLMDSNDEEEEWALDELPEQFFAEPALEEVVAPVSKEPFSTPIQSQTKAKPVETASEVAQEDLGEEQFYLEPID